MVLKSLKTDDLRMRYMQMVTSYQSADPGTKSIVMNPPTQFVASGTKSMLSYSVYLNVARLQLQESTAIPLVL